VGDGLSIAPQNRRDDEDDAGHVSRSSSLLRLEVSRARVSQSDLKTGRGMTRVVHVAPSCRLCGSEAKDGPCYPYFAVFIVLCSRGNLVF
jgi:hypothetical protein